MPLANALCSAQNWDSDRPATSGDESLWPSGKSPILRNQPLNMLKIPGGQWSWGWLGTAVAHAAKYPGQGPSLEVVNTTTIPTYRTCSLTLDLGLRCTFIWVFIIADFCRPIIGAIFLKHYGVLVDPHSKHLTDSLTQLKVQGTISPVTSSLILSLLSKQSAMEYKRIFWGFPTITGPYKNYMEITHDVIHHITTKRSPVCARPRQFCTRMTEDCLPGIWTHDGPRTNLTLIKELGFSTTYGT